MNRFEAFLKDVTKTFDKITNFIQSSKIDLKVISDRFEYIQNQLPEDMQNESRSLMNRGWFIFEIFLHEEGLINKNSVEQDNYMKHYIISNMNLIEEILINKYPKRKNQILEAFEAHRKKLYFCSIPTLLAISEGIGRERYDIGIFEKENRLPKTRYLLNEIESDDFIRASFTPLDESSEITRSIKNPTSEEKTLLNRHLILHGLSDKYGNEINSLKTISLIFYIHNSLDYLSSKY